MGRDIVRRTACLLGERSSSSLSSCSRCSPLRSGQCRCGGSLFSNWPFLLLLLSPRPFSMPSGKGGAPRVDSGTHPRHQWRWAEGSLDQFAALVAEIIRLPVEVLVVPNLTTARIAQKATSTMPIVVRSGGSLATSELVASQAHPGAMSRASPP